MVSLQYLLFNTIGRTLSENWAAGTDLVNSGVSIIDGHNDFPIWIRAFYHNHIYASNFSDTQSLFGQVDFPRLQKGGLSGQFWSVYVECPREPHSLNSGSKYQVVRDTLEQIDLVHRLIETFPNHLEFASLSSDLIQDRRSHAGNKIQSLLGIEGLHQIGGSAAVLRMYHRLGVRYATLTHTCHNEFADSEEPIDTRNGGLSRLGSDLIAEMNRLGMMVDLSHTSWQTQQDVFECTKAPVIYSHSNSYALCPHTRNVPDEFLFRLKENGGVLMITFYPQFVECTESSEASLSKVVDHILYVAKLIGWEHLGIGSDFDGMPAGPQGLEDVSKYPALIDELRERGVTADMIKLVAGKNIIRVMKQVEDVAISLRSIHPMEDDIEPFFDGQTGVSP